MTVGCDTCDARFRADGIGAVCPACGQGALAGAEGGDGEPELAIAYATTAKGVSKSLADYAGGIWFPTADLSEIPGRVVQVWWPRWLVDAAIDGTWEAQAGFDYEVASTQEVYSGGWTTREVTDTRIRWEPRAGRAALAYDNISVPALAIQDGGQFSGSKPWSEAQAGPWIRLPDRSQVEQWPTAVQALRSRVSADCIRACSADHIRDFYLEMSADQADWTWLLTPMWASWYTDDDGVRHVIRVDGVSGEVSGPRLASKRKGRVWAGILFSAAAISAAVGLFIGLIGIVLWPLLVVAAVLLVLALVLACVAIWPAVHPGRWNKGQSA